jgi:hypothetical protein
MIEEIPDLPGAIVGLRARGKVTKEDYEQMVEPRFADLRREGGRRRCLFHFGSEFEGFTASAAWEDLKVGWRYVRLFERCAVVSDLKWIRAAWRASGAVMPFSVRVFGNDAMAEAIAWLREPAEAVALDHHLLADRGVLVLEPKGRLRAEDFDAVAATVDPWLDANGMLQGIVVHVPSFPGWESVGGFLRHVTFVRDHHRRVRRVAIAADGKVAEFVAGSVGHFVEAEVRRFAHGEFERGLAWAAGGGA